MRNRFDDIELALRVKDLERTILRLKERGDNEISKGQSLILNSMLKLTDKLDSEVVRFGSDYGL